MPKVVHYVPKLYGEKQLITTHTEQTILHLEVFMARLRRYDDIRTLQRILFNKQQLVEGAQDYILHIPFSRYPYCEHYVVTFLWYKLSALNVKVDVQGAETSQVPPN